RTCRGRRSARTAAPTRGRSAGSPAGRGAPPERGPAPEQERVGLRREAVGQLGVEASAWGAPAAEPVRPAAVLGAAVSDGARGEPGGGTTERLGRGLLGMGRRRRRWWRRRTWWRRRMLGLGLSRRFSGGLAPLGPLVGDRRRPGRRRGVRLVRLVVVVRGVVKL